MSYTVNGKVYTDHPLMDEIVYNCKLILKGLVVKNDILANSFETEESLKNSEILTIIRNGKLTLALCPFTYESLKAFGYNNRLANSCLIDHNNVPVEDREKIIEFTSNYFLEHFEEKNKYYRMLIGLPEYGTDEYNVYIDRSYFPSNYDKEIDFSKPLHEMSNEIIAILEGTGKIDKILQEYRGSNYSYIRFLGDKKLDLYNVRKAGKWDILYIPSVESLVEDRFKELYNLNKEVYLKRTYQDAYAFSSEYYEQCMILLVICQTFTDMIVDVPEWYIRRDVFDIRSVQYFLDSYGVRFFKEIPLKYQIRIVKNLNKLIKYKSSNKNNTDILEIFALKDTAIYKYYLYKKRLTDGYGNYTDKSDENDNYDLEFIQCKLGDTYDNYIKDQIYRTTYDDITYQDKYWDGEDSHQYIKDLHLNRDFTIEGTKYMSIEYKISLSEYLYQMQFFLGLILDSNLDSDDIKISVPSIQPSVTFKLSDLFIFLSLLSLGYDGASDKVIRPEDNMSDKTSKPEFEKYFDFNGGYPGTSDNEYDSIYSPNGGEAKLQDSIWYLNTDGGQNVEYSEIKSNEYFYDWMKKYYPELFVDKKNRVFGFNSDIDMNELSEIIGRRHSQYQFDNGFTLEELGVDSYQIPSKVSSVKELISLYENNTKCYKTLKKKMVEEVDDRDEFMVLQFVFDSLFTKEFDYKFYTINNHKTDANYLGNILQDRDYLLYTIYNKIMSENNSETRKDNIRNIMNDVVNTLEYYLSDDGLDYIFAFTSISSFNSLIHYIYLMINFFKSYKVYFLDPYITYISDDKLENAAGARYDAIAEKKISYWKEDKEFHRDSAIYEVTLYHEESPEHKRIVETIDIHGHFDPDPDDDYDYDGKYADTDEDFKDANGSYADNKSCIPFVVINGGSAQGSRRDLWDLNGAGALEMQNYVVADGGKEFNYDDLRQDYYGKAFNYIIDGGSSSTNNFFTNSMHIKVIDRQIEASVRVSKNQYNLIEEKEDGLYLQQQWGSWADFDELTDETSNTFEYFSSMYNDILDTVRISSNPELLDERIEQCIGLYLQDMRKVMDYIESDTFENNLNSYTDDKVAQLYSEFYGFSPYTWEEF